MSSTTPVAFVDQLGRKEGPVGPGVHHQFLGLALRTCLGRVNGTLSSAQESVPYLEQAGLVPSASQMLRIRLENQGSQLRSSLETRRLRRCLWKTSPRMRQVSSSTCCVTVSDQKTPGLACRERELKLLAHFLVLPLGEEARTHHRASSDY